MTEPSDLLEFELASGGAIFVRESAIGAIVPVFERPGESILLVDGREFTVLGKAGEIAQALLAD